MKYRSQRLGSKRLKGAYVGDYIITGLGFRV